MQILFAATIQVIATIRLDRGVAISTVNGQLVLLATDPQFSLRLS
jgi:hypothetical protein